jgi:hypothetical protein
MLRGKLCNDSALESILLREKECDFDDIKGVKKVQDNRDKGI